MTSSEPPRKYEISILQDIVDTPEDGNVDVVVYMEGGSRYGATFFTLDNVHHLFRRYEKSGECKGGLYFWSDGMVLVRQLSQSTIEQTVEGLIQEGALEKVFRLLVSECPEEFPGPNRWA